MITRDKIQVTQQQTDRRTEVVEASLVLKTKHERGYYLTPDKSLMESIKECCVRAILDEIYGWIQYDHIEKALCDIAPPDNHDSSMFLEGGRQAVKKIYQLAMQR